MSQSRRLLLGIVAAFVLVAVYVLGSYHVVRGKSVGMQLVAKETFTFRESFPIMEEITEVPFFAAINRYPLTVRALQRDGMIETDDQREDRVNKRIFGEGYGP